MNRELNELALLRLACSHVQTEDKDTLFLKGTHSFDGNKPKNQLISMMQSSANKIVTHKTCTLCGYEWEEVTKNR